MEEKNKKWDYILSVIWDWVKTIAVALIITFFVKFFIVDATRVSGDSMLNTLHSDDMLLLNKVGKYFGDYKRGQIVIIKAPDYPNRLYVKRVIGTPGDTVVLKDGKVLINGNVLEEKYIASDHTLEGLAGNEFILGSNEYLVFGDNRDNSNDSRNFGKIYKVDIVGHAFLRFYPFADAGLIDNNPYK